MNKLFCFFIGFILLSPPSFGETVYDRVLKKSLYSGDLNNAQKMIAKGANINGIKNDKAAGFPESSLIFLINQGYKLNIAKNEDCIIGDVFREQRKSSQLYNIVSLLISKGANPNCIANDGYGGHSLHSAATYWTPSNPVYIKAFDLLLSKSKKYVDHYKTGGCGCTPMEHAIKKGSREIIDRLILAGSNVNLPTSKKYRRRSALREYTPTHHAIYRGDLELLKYFISKGARVTKAGIKTAEVIGIDEIEMFLLELPATSKAQKTSPVTKQPMQDHKKNASSAPKKNIKTPVRAAAKSVNHHHKGRYHSHVLPNNGTRPHTH